MKETRKMLNREATQEEQVEILLSLLGSDKETEEDGIYVDDDGSVYTL